MKLDFSPSMQRFVACTIQINGSKYFICSCRLWFIFIKIRSYSPNKFFIYSQECQFLLADIKWTGNATLHYSFSYKQTIVLAGRVVFYSCEFFLYIWCFFYIIWIGKINCINGIFRQKPPPENIFNVKSSELIKNLYFSLISRGKL